MRVVYICLVVVLLVACVDNNKVSFKLVTSGTIKPIAKIEIQPIYIYPTKSKHFPLTDREEKGYPQIMDVDYVALQSDKGFVGYPEKLVFKKDRIILHDGLLNNESVFVFDMLGNCIRRIASQGRGPKEFSGVQDIFVSDINDVFFVKDRYSSKILAYDLDGNCLAEMHSRVNSTMYHELDDKMIYASSHNQNYQCEDIVDYCVFTGKGDSILYRGFPFKPFQSSEYETVSMSVNYNGDVQLWQHAVDTLFRITTDSTYTTPYIFKFDKSIQHELEALPTGSDYSGEYRRLSKADYWDLRPFVVENDNCLVYECGIGGGRYGRFIYSKNKDESFHIIPKKNFYRFPFHLIYHAETPMAVYNNRFVSVIEGHDVYRYKQDKMISRKNDDGSTDSVECSFANLKLAKIIENSSENSNPVLMFFRYEFN